MLKITDINALNLDLSEQSQCIIQNSGALTIPFKVEKPGTVWVGDITYIRVASYWIYLTVVIDLADRMVVGWSLSKGMNA